MLRDREIELERQKGRERDTVRKTLLRTVSMKVTGNKIKNEPVGQTQKDRRAERKREKRGFLTGG